MSTCLGACREFDAGSMQERSAASARPVCFIGYMWDLESQTAAGKRVINIAENHSRTIAFDLAGSFAVRRDREAFLSLLYDDVHVAFANGEEIRGLCSANGRVSGLEYLAKLCEIAVVQDGDRGPPVAAGDRCRQIPAGFSVPVGTTGAGDMYAHATTESESRSDG